VTYTSRYVIQAIPTPFSADIHYDPPMAATRQHLVENTHMGIYTKVHFLCEERFWADKHTNTEKFLFGGMNANGPLVIFADGSYPQGKGDTAMIVGFLIPPSADEWNRHTQEERRQAAAAELNRMMSKTSTGMGPYSTCEYRENRWEDDPWGKGVTVVVKAGTLHLYGSGFVRPQGRIHFAGSDSSPIWHGYMEGALYSGERAAAEVAQRLNTEPQTEAEHSQVRVDSGEETDEDMSSAFWFNDVDHVQDAEFNHFSELEDMMAKVGTLVSHPPTAGSENDQEANLLKNPDDTDEERFRQVARQHLLEAKNIAKKHKAYLHRRRRESQARSRAHLQRKARKSSRAASIQPL